jgi:hypothetical protein
MRKLVLIVSIILSTLCCFSQPKILSCVKASQPPKIDGNLDDAAWQNAALAKDFVQYFPTPYSTPTARSEVRILYDNDAVYIAAYLYDDPSLIRRQLTSRDGEQQADTDYFSVFFDTYNDLQNGFQFLVTTANVQTDTKLDADDHGFEGGDRSWDAVWQSKTSMKADGWVVEMRIPYISLRFAKKDVQTWGVQFGRFIRRNTETDYWSPIDPKLSGFVNQFGKLSNLEDIQPPLRLSFSPYVSGGVRVPPPGSKGQTEWLRSGGMDVKYGINESFTLDATIIPDFGQVVSDNVVNNLTPFEIQFQENRPFFTEGTELFSKSGLFYSRRVGATPMDYNRVRSLVTNPDYTLIKNPAPTQLYNAVKFSGRTQKKLGIGVFNAVTAPMRAEVYSNITKSDSLIQTGPLTNYNIIVLDQAFKGRSYVTFTNTNVMRNGMLRDANVSAFDFGIYDKTNTYSLRGTARYSSIFGYTPYSLLSSTPYSFISGLDTTIINGRRYAPAYDGFASSLRFSKVSGKIQYAATANMKSHAYDINDLGYLEAPNDVNYIGHISYNQFEPKGKFFTYNYTLQLHSRWLYRPYKFSFFEITGTGFWLFRNMWDVTLTLGSRPTATRDYFELRTPGKHVNRPWYAYAFLSGSTDSRKRLYADYDFGFAEGAIENNPYHHANIGVRYRFSNKFTLNLRGSTLSDKNQIGFASRESTGEPIGGFRDFKELSTILSGTYNFTPRINFTARVRHYWSKVEYNKFFNVDSEGDYVDRAFVPDEDFNFNVFNLDAFFTWDFRLGSRIILGWKNWLGDDHQDAINLDDYKNYLGNLGRTLELPHGNELSLRIIYFLDYNQLKGRR